MQAPRARHCEEYLETSYVAARLQAADDAHAGRDAAPLGAWLRWRSRAPSLALRVFCDVVRLSLQSLAYLCLSLWSCASIEDVSDCARAGAPRLRGADSSVAVLSGVGAPAELTHGALYTHSPPPGVCRCRPGGRRAGACGVPLRPHVSHLYGGLEAVSPRSSDPGMVDAAQHDGANIFT